VHARSAPIDILVVGFDGEELNRDIGPALRDLVALEGLCVVDVLFVHRGADGRVGSLGLDDLRPLLEMAAADDHGPLRGGLLDPADAEEVGPDLAPGTSALLLAVEHAWTVSFSDAVRASGGEILDHARVPAAAVDEVRHGAV
jgi:hypothetical protein